RENRMRRSFFDDESDSPGWTTKRSLIDASVGTDQVPELYGSHAGREPVREIPPQQDRVLLHGRKRKCQRSERAAHDGPGTEAGGLADRIVQVRERSGRGARVRVVVHLVDEVL